MRWFLETHGEQYSACVAKFHSRRQFFANAAIAASRVGS
jgi:hypothetical protein